MYGSRSVRISLHDECCSLWSPIICSFILPEIWSQMSNLSSYSISQLPSPELKTGSHVSICCFRVSDHPFIYFSLVVRRSWYGDVCPAVKDKNSKLEYDTSCALDTLGQHLYLGASISKLRSEAAMHRK